MFGFNKDKQQEQGAKEISQAEVFVKDIMRSFPGSSMNRDVYRQELIVSVPVNNEVLFAIGIPYNFPLMQPTVRLLDSTRSNLQGIKALADSGLLDLQTGGINYNSCFTWTPNISGSLFMFLLGLIVKVAVKTAISKPQPQMMPMVAVHNQQPPGPPMYQQMHNQVIPQS